MAALKPSGLNPLVAQLLEDEPVQNWAQGANHLAKALFRGLELRDQKQRESRLSEALLGLPGLGGAVPQAQGAPSPAPMPSPAPSPMPAMPGRPSPMPSSMPGNVSGPVPADDPTMTVSPRQVAQANAPQGQPLSFNDRFSAISPPTPNANPVQTMPVAPPQAPPVAPPAPQAPPASPQIPQQEAAYIKMLLARSETREMGMQMYQKARERAMKPPEFGVIGKDEYGNERRGWIDPQTRTTTPANPSAPNFVDTKKLRDEVRDLPSYKNLAQSAPVYKSMFDAAGRDNRAADVNLIYGMAKIMDPGSVVRESEMTVAQAVSTLPQHLQASIMSQLNATGRLSPEVRAAIMQEAQSRIQSYQSMFDNDMTMYRGIAESGRFNPAHVIPQFGPFEAFKPPAPPAGQTGQPTQGQPSPQGARPRAQNAQGQVIEFDGQKWVPVQ